MSYTPPVGVATVSKPGLVQLAGDLGGPGTSATSPKITGGYAQATGGGAETLVTANSGTAYTVNLANGNVFDLTLTGNVTLTFSGATASKACSFSLYLRQDAVGGRSVTWPVAVLWSGGAPTLTTAANTVDILVFETLNAGSTWYGSLVGSNYS